MEESLPPGSSPHPSSPNLPSTPGLATAGKFHPGLVKKWLGLLTFEVRSPKGSLKIAFGSSLGLT